MNKLSLLIPILLIQSYLSIIVETNGKKDMYCFNKFVEERDILNLSYVVTGDENSEKINAFVKDEDEITIYNNIQESEGSFSLEVRKGGKHKVCFSAVDGKEYYISFEFYTNNEKGHTLDLAKDTNIHDLKKDTSEIALMMEQIEKNTRFIIDRRMKHTEIISQIIRYIKNMSYLKIFIVIGVSLLQVYLIHKFYASNDKRSTGYKPSSIYEMQGI
jgi:hypothetical protein